MTKDEIKKALTCCSNPSISYCKDCPYANYGEFDCCNGKMCKDALNLITEQEKEIDFQVQDRARLQREIDELEQAHEQRVEEIERLKAEVKQAKIDILNELKKKTHNYYPSIDSYCVSQHVVLVRDIDNLIKELNK